MCRPLCFLVGTNVVVELRLGGGGAIFFPPFPVLSPQKWGGGKWEDKRFFVWKKVVLGLRLGGGGQFYSPLFLLRTHTQAAGVSREMKVFLFSISYLFYCFIFVLAFLCVSFSAVGFLIDFYVNVWVPHRPECSRMVGIIFVSVSDACFPNPSVLVAIISEVDAFSFSFTCATLQCITPSHHIFSIPPLTQKSNVL